MNDCKLEDIGEEYQDKDGSVWSGTLKSEADDGYQGGYKPKVLFMLFFHDNDGFYVEEK